MNLPPSSLLGRLEAFLPELEKANQSTEKLAQEGKLEVLDSNLEVAGTEQHREEAEEDEEDEATEGVEQDEGGAEGGAAPATRTVQLVSARIISWTCAASAREGLSVRVSESVLLLPFFRTIWLFVSHIFIFISWPRLGQQWEPNFMLVATFSMWTSSCDNWSSPRVASQDLSSLIQLRCYGHSAPCSAGQTFGCRYTRSRIISIFRAHTTTTRNSPANDTL